jgi:hypothetical protein
MHRLYLLFLLLSALPLVAQYDPCGSTLSGPTGAAGNFGQTLALSGDGSVLAVGAVLEGENNGGAVRIYRRNGVGYEQLGETITTDAPNALYGRAIALNGNGSRLVFSSTERKAGANTGFSVYVYDLTAEGYTLTGLLRGSSFSLQFGADLDISNDGTRLAIGDPGRGIVFLYDYNPDNEQWEEFDQRIATTPSGAFGSQVALSGDGLHLLVGAEEPGADNDLNPVFQYRYDALEDAFAEVREYNGQIGGADYGTALDIDDDGDTYMISDPGEDVGQDIEGNVFVYRYRPDGTQRFFASAVSPSDDSRFGQFGAAAALSGDGNTLVVGDYNYGDPEFSRGRVYIYEIPENGLLTLIGENIIGDESFYYTGRAVAVTTDGSRIAVGSSLANSNDGLVRVYSSDCQAVSTRQPELPLPGLSVYTDGSHLRVDFGEIVTQDVMHSTLIAADGRVMAQRSDRGGRGYAWVQHLPRGVYVLRLESAGRVLARKFVW